ncbi:MAG TPA: transcriptional repressor LexA [Paenalcaligenes sp.]|nr:transcriptional repressor LexA [Paenalcaligenes sp.]
MTVKLTPRQQQILDIIKEKIAAYGYPPTRVEIARKLGFRSPNAAEDHLKALARKGVIELIAGTSRGIRLTDRAQPEDTDVGSGSVDSAPMPHAQPQSEHLNLAVIGRVAAGSPVLAAEHVEKELSFGAHMFQSKPDYLLRVRGLSMRDAGILEGDLLAVKKTTDAHHGQIVVARLGDEVTVKRIEVDENSQRIKLHSENPDYQPIHVAPGDDFEIEGVAVGLIRDWALNS